ncbi:MAG: hypothetical protein ACM34E_19110 [Acidobacteriota bacterium]
MGEDPIFLSMNTEQVSNKAEQEWVEKAKGTARDAGAAADLYLHEYAWTSVAIIAVVAWTLGYLMGARSR